MTKFLTWLSASIGFVKLIIVKYGIDSVCLVDNYTILVLSGFILNEPAGHIVISDAINRVSTKGFYDHDRCNRTVIT